MVIVHNRWRHVLMKDQLGAGHFYTLLHWSLRKPNQLSYLSSPLAPEEPEAQRTNVICLRSE